MPSASRQLVSDFRRVMEPRTAGKLRERRSNCLKDYEVMAGPLGITHFWSFSQGERSLQVRLGRFPGGPTASFRVESFSLMRDLTRVFQEQQRARTSKGSLGMAGPLGPEGYRYAPLLVLSGFEGAATSSEDRLLCTLLRNAFPTVDTGKCKLSDLRRVAFFERDPEEQDVLHFRHYAIRLRMTGVSKPIRRLLARPDAIASALGRLTDIQQLVTERSADAIVSASESEADPEADVDLSQSVQEMHPRDARRGIVLTEIGPRMRLRLTHLHDAFFSGQLLYSKKAAQSD